LLATFEHQHRKPRPVEVASFRATLASLLCN